MKHDPNLIIEIANRLKHLKFLIIAFGNGYDSLKRNDKLPKNIYPISIQPFDKINEILSSADICLSILNKDASKFSVPSKILNYLCAGKTIFCCVHLKTICHQRLLTSQIQENLLNRMR